MRKNVLTVFALMMLGVFSLAGTALADANEVVALKNELKDLKGELASLKGQVSSLKSAPKSSYSAPARSQSGGGLINVPQNIDMGGYVEVQWNTNFAQPEGTAGANTLRIFDTDDSSFSVNSAELYFEKAAEEVGDAGFRIDIQLGEDANVVGADGNAANDIDLQQAYVEYITAMPEYFVNNEILPDSVHIMAGRFATLAGYEVIEGPDNWNISRNYLFEFALPFTHTGVRTNFGLFNDKLDVYFGVNNGWDQAVDVNSHKTLEWAVGYEPWENVSIFHAFYLGQEGRDAAFNRFLTTHVITWQATDKLTIVGDIDYGKDNNRFGRSNADWYGFAWYANYQFTDRFAMTFRQTFFADDHDTRLATGGGGADHVFSNTITAEYKITDNLITRGEFRLDKASENQVFSPGVGDTVTAGAQTGGDSTMFTMGAQVIYVI